MTEVNGSPSGPGPDPDIGDIQADIERTRSQLGETVGALSDKVDVKQRAKQKAVDTKDLVTDRAHDITAKSSEIGTHAVDAVTAKTGLPRPAASVTAVVLTTAIVAGVVVWKRRH